MKILTEKRKFYSLELSASVGLLETHFRVFCKVNGSQTEGVRFDSYVYELHSGRRLGHLLRKEVVWKKKSLILDGLEVSVQSVPSLPFIKLWEPPLGVYQS